MSDDAMDGADRRELYRFACTSILEAIHALSLLDDQPPCTDLAEAFRKVQPFTGLQSEHLWREYKERAEREIDAMQEQDGDGWL